MYGLIQEHKNILTILSFSQSLCFEINKNEIHILKIITVSKLIHTPPSFSFPFLTGIYTLHGTFISHPYHKMATPGEQSQLNS